MTVSVVDNSIRLTGPCGVEEVETLVGYMDLHPDLYIDLSAATTIHTALWQAMMVFRPSIRGTPASSSISDKVFAELTANLGESR
ncbi:hypothetical protein ASE04_18790 [Rhizobium sp. Root708]|uniref:hypothetical protein n=1 Tax=Rhizobium sp. Root708 TaxID=1736592 RepID=UPI0006F83E53|nr:hypothetical protein [Rhizobium sp. Root708]KRB49220.1 hypothetical protein ASE04_18790 [Rhizobium sp. Root708]